jgi:hypothetical protein
VSFVPQRLDGIEPRSLERRIPPETGADQGADDQSREGPAPRKDHGDLQPDGDDVAARDAQEDAQKAAELGEHDGLEEELLDDVVAARADGFAHADLARALGDADQHDVHDADARRQERDHADHERADADDPRHLRERGDEGVVRVDLEVVLLPQLQPARGEKRDKL